MEESYWITRVSPRLGLSSSQIIELARLNTYRQHQMLWKLFNLPGHLDDERGDFLFRAESNAGMPLFYIISREKPKEYTGIWRVESKAYDPDIIDGDRLAFKLRANPVQHGKKPRSITEIESWRARRKARGLKEKAPTKKRIRHDVVMDAQKRLLTKLAESISADTDGKKSEVKDRILQIWNANNHTIIRNHLVSIIEKNENFREIQIPDNRSQLLELALKAHSNKALERWLTKQGETNYGFALLRSSQYGKLKFQAEGYMQHFLPKKGEKAKFSSMDFEGQLIVTDAMKFKKALFKGIGPAKGFGCGLMLVRRV